MKKKKCPVEKKRKPPARDMMETCNISPWGSLGKIIPTSTKKKEDLFDSYRPNRKCVDYKISETWTKMQKGDVKINMRQTCATYEEMPPEICKTFEEKKEKLFSGGPPQWKFVSEIYQENMERCQKDLKKLHKKMVLAARIARCNRLTREHAIVQRLVGPDWFMELSPKQIEAVDKLRESIYADIRTRSTCNSQDILAALGLVLRPSRKHVEKAIRHCCGDPVEFLLIVYQLIDPKRQSYSLNDRILLSAVVHLSITSTLQELHVRIPSPPRADKKVSTPKKKIAKVKYESPYLEPLKYEPAPPKYTGIYKNNHKQYPESPYFSYLKDNEGDKRCSSPCLNYTMTNDVEEKKARIAEYKEAQNFFSSLPGVKQKMLNLIYPSQRLPCPNFLHPIKKEVAIKEKLIAPHLCKVAPSEPVICFCEENRQKLNPNFKPVKRSCCEKSAQKYLKTGCLCDGCLEKIAQKNTVRIHGGFHKPSCKCDEPVPIIQGTLWNKTCECYKNYRDKVVCSAGRQCLSDQKHKYVVGGVIITQNGPIYQILTTVGDKICKCGEIKQRKKQIRQIKETMWNNKANFAIGGVTMSKLGPVYNLTAVVARRPCKCLIKYRAQLKILTMQNKVRKNPSCFVNKGIVIGKHGPMYHLSNCLAHAAKSPLDLQEVCSCEIKKPKCFQRCYDYVEYKVSRHTPPSSSKSTEATSSETTQSKESCVGVDTTCPDCGRGSVTKNKTTQVDRKKKTSKEEIEKQCLDLSACCPDSSSSSSSSSSSCSSSSSSSSSSKHDSCCSTCSGGCSSDCSSDCSDVSGCSDDSFGCPTNKLELKRKRKKKDKATKKKKGQKENKGKDKKKKSKDSGKKKVAQRSAAIDEMSEKDNSDETSSQNEVSHCPNCGRNSKGKDKASQACNKRNTSKEEIEKQCLDLSWCCPESSSSSSDNDTCCSSDCSEDCSDDSGCSDDSELKRKRKNKERAKKKKKGKNKKKDKGKNKVSTRSAAYDETSEDEISDETSSQTQLIQSGGGKSACPYCGKNSANRNKAAPSCSKRKSSSSSSSQLSSSDSSSVSSTESSSTKESDKKKKPSDEENKSSDKDERSCKKKMKSAEKTSSCDDSSAPTPCRCKEELNRFMQAKCPCEDCNNRLNQSTATYIMGGTKETSSGNKINVVQGVQQPTCGCMKNHQEYIRKIDEYKSRVKARYDLKKQPQKYCICGVKDTPDGPVYIISGMRPPVDCECAKAQREKEEQRAAEKQRAKMPHTGRMKYEIVGVKGMPDENVYILSRALNIQECKCEEVLSTFEGAHMHCMKEFERYLELTINEIKELEDELNEQQHTRRGTLLNEEDIEFDMEHKKMPMSNSQGLVNPGGRTYLEDIKEESESPPETPVLPEDVQEEPTKDPGPSEQPTEDNECACADNSEEDSSSSSSSSSYSSSSSDDDESSSNSDTTSQTTDTERSECGSCHVENPPEVRPVHMPTDKLFPDSFLSKRFAIFREFPKDLKTQLQILQHILQGMADDGFPLAKLPQVYKLPIFKLWLQMRSEVYWTYEDRLKYYGRSKDLWKHTLVCGSIPRTEQLPFTLDEAHAMTWKHANLIRKEVSNNMNSFYRKLKQISVDAGREFFAPTFSYEFPTPAWRDCAFAYLPTKEEDVFAYKIVKPHDTRVIPENKRMNCYC